MENKFYTLQPWLYEILDSIRRDIKTDYLPASGAVYRAHFGNRPQNRLTMQEINTALIKELLQGNEDLAEWVVNRWVFKHGEIYQYFASSLEAISPDFGSLQELSEADSQALVLGAKEAFGVKLVYFFSLLNGVVFPASVFAALRQEVEAQAQAPAQTTPAAITPATEEKHRRELARLAEKYEQKIAGIMKKYSQDVHSLKTQVRALQKKLV